VRADRQERFAGYSWMPPTVLARNGFCPVTSSASVTGDGVDLTGSFQVTPEPGAGKVKPQTEAIWV
jgi:hypothetical protein